MNIIVTIEGKEAIPVRAIALLTDWEVLSPDVCANAFSGNEEIAAPSFEGMATYRLLAHGGIEPVAARWWDNWVVRELDACSKRITAAQTDHETGYQQWRHDAFRLMPAGVFVWRDAFEAAHQLQFGQGSMLARFDKQYDAGRYRLNFNPEHGPGQDWRQVVLEGFESLRNVADVAPPEQAVPLLNQSAAPEPKAAPEWKEQSQDVQELALMLLADEAPDHAQLEAAFFEGFHGGHFDLHQWLVMSNVTPNEAAQFLSAKDPMQAPDDAKTQMLARVFKDEDARNPANRTLLDWLGVARSRGADYDESAANFVEQRTPEGTQHDSANVKPVSRREAQDAAVLDAVRQLGFDPLALPKSAPGKPGVKAATRALLVGHNALFQPTSTVFTKTWERLLSQGSMAYIT